MGWFNRCCVPLEYPCNLCSETPTTNPITVTFSGMADPLVGVYYGHCANCNNLNTSFLFYQDGQTACKWFYHDPAWLCKTGKTVDLWMVLWQNARYESGGTGILQWALRLIMDDLPNWYTVQYFSSGDYNFPLDCGNQYTLTHVQSSGNLDYMCSPGYVTITLN